MTKRGFIPEGVTLKEVNRPMPDVSNPFHRKSIDITVEILLTSDGDVSGVTKENVEEAIYNALPDLIEVEKHEKTMRSIIHSKIKSIEEELDELKSTINDLKS